MREERSKVAGFAMPTRRVAPELRSLVPVPVRRRISGAYWLAYDSLDFIAELVGAIPSHTLRVALYRLLRVAIGSKTSIHRGCRLYWPSRVSIGANTIINRNVLLDGRMGLRIGDNVSISEGTTIFTLEHDPNSPDFSNRGAPVAIEDYAFIGAKATILPGVIVGCGAVVAAGAVVTHHVEPFTIVGGVPARLMGERARNLTYQLNYRKFLG
jgi:acetyltransferase-like isoleucine patch superfamily enzyme